MIQSCNIESSSPAASVPNYTNDVLDDVLTDPNAADSNTTAYDVVNSSNHISDSDKTHLDSTDINSAGIDPTDADPTDADPTDDDSTDTDSNQKTILIILLVILSVIFVGLIGVSMMGEPKSAPTRLYDWLLKMVT